MNTSTRPEQMAKMHKLTGSDNLETGHYWWLPIYLADFRDRTGNWQMTFVTPECPLESGYCYGPLTPPASLFQPGPCEEQRVAPAISETPREPAKCSQCEYWDGDPDTRLASGSCQRFPPTVIKVEGADDLYYVFPITRRDGWCGECSGT